MPTELINIIYLLSDNLTLYILIIFIVFYLLISLFSWNFIKPSKYLGISNIVVGIIIIILRFSFNFIINLIIPKYINILKILLPSIVKPLIISGIISIIFGIVMIICYFLINKYKVKKV